MGLLDGRRAVVTGGASGIGRATARRMVEEGATVAVIDVDGDGAARWPQSAASSGSRRM